MMVCLCQKFFNLLYDYFQTSLINYICMSHFYSQTRTFFCFPQFLPEFRTHCFFLAPWYSQILNQRLRILASRRATLHFRPGLHQQPGDWMQDRQFGCPRERAVGLFQCSGIGRSPFPPTTFLRSCLMLLGLPHRGHILIFHIQT